MKRFAFKLLVFSLPFLSIVLSYVVFDPFKVLYHYDDFYENYFVNLNRDYISSQLLIQNYPTYKYDSYIFGSSRTMAFKTNDWKTHIDSSSSPFLFDAAAETIFGIWTKISFLEKKHLPIDNALIIICGDHTFSNEVDSEGHLFIKDPGITGEVNHLPFQNAFFTVYLKDGFFIRYLDYKLFKKKRSYMRKNFEFLTIKNDVITNDLYIVDQERKVLQDSSTYYKERESIFYKRSGIETYRPSQISERSISMLMDIKKVFDKDHTKYHFVISPLYDQKKLNKQDVEALIRIFGKEYIHDYSGINEITNCKYNYFETSHYRHHVGRKIMQDIYETKK